MGDSVDTSLHACHSFSTSQCREARKPRRRAGTTRERLGCLTCRIRRKKCDELYPICGHCRRLNLVCKREEPRKIVPESPQAHDRGLHIKTSQSLKISRRNFISNIPKPIDSSPFNHPVHIGKGQDRRAFLSYYTQVLAVILTTSHDNNSFLSVFLPMAMDSIPLQASLIAWSSAHLSRSSKSHVIHALESHSVALAQVASSICTLKETFSPSTADTLLASCLVLSATEIAHGDTEHWYKHLKGAKEIIMAAECVETGGKQLKGPECFAMERDGQWLLRNFAYHDVLGCVTSNEEPLISGAYWLHDEATVVDSYVGVGSEILAMLSDICKLDDGTKHHLASSFAGQISELQLSGQATNEFWQVADELEFRLQEWKCPDASDDGLIELAESYRGAAFITLYRKQRSRCVNYSEGRCLSLFKDKIATAVQKTILHIQRIPLLSLPECGLLFPLFMAGGDTLEASHIEIVRSRLHLLLENRRFGNIARASEVLEEFWRLRITGVADLQGRDLDWKNILREKVWHLTLV